MTNPDVAQLTELVVKGFSDMEKRFDAIDERFEGVDDRFDRVEARLDQIEVDIRDIKAELRDISRRPDILEERVGGMGGYAKEIDELREKQRDLEAQVKTLEAQAA